MSEKITESYKSKKEAEDRHFKLYLKGFLMSPIKQNSKTNEWEFEYIPEDREEYEGFTAID